MWIPSTFDEYKKYFLHSSPGDFKNKFVKLSKNFSLLLTEDGLKLMDYVNNSALD